MNTMDVNIFFIYYEYFFDFVNITVKKVQPNLRLLIKNAVLNGNIDGIRSERKSVLLQYELF